MSVPITTLKNFCQQVGEHPCAGPNYLLEIDGVDTETCMHASMHGLMLCLERELDKRIGEKAAPSATPSQANLNRSLEAAMDDFVGLHGPCEHAVAWNKCKLALANFWSHFAGLPTHCYEKET